MKKRITFDFETRSRCELKKAGAYKYSLHPSTRPTCLAFKFHGQKTVYFLDFDKIMLPWEKHPNGVRELWQGAINEGYEFSAHDAFFETCIYKNILVKRLGWPDIPSRQFRCTAAKAAACCLPRDLQGAGSAMNLTIQKDRRGYAAVMATCKPTKKYNDWVKACNEVKSGRRVGPKKVALAKMPAPPLFLEPDNDPQGVFPVLYEYCKIDVLAEERLDDALPDLIPQEQEIWFLNQKLNWRGLRVDIETSQKAVEILAVESEAMKEELDTLTMGLITKPGAINSILEFLALDGVELPNLRSKTVDDALKDEKLPTAMKRLLEIRKALSRTSTKKYQSFLDRANSDGRVRDILMYHGAGTGRDTGTGIQPHNFPRGLIKVSEARPYAAVENVIECDSDMLKLFYGKNLSVLFSSILRNMILPTKDYDMFVADFSKIEVAVLWWLADNKPGLKVLREGKDPYIYQAAANLGKTYEEIEAAVKAKEQWAVDARQLGKGQVLGCGFGMGGPKFQTTAWDMYRLKLTEDQSFAAVRSYREQNATVPLLWRSYETAAIQVVRNGQGALTTAGYCKFFNHKGFLWIQLPSGRRLAYKAPQIVMRETDFGPRESLEFWGAKGKHWRLERTWGGTITENIVQAVARDLMMLGILRLERAGYRALLTVHDEAICEREIGTGDVGEFVKLLCTRPKWAEGCPIEASGWSGPRYRK